MNFDSLYTHKLEQYCYLYQLPQARPTLQYFLHTLSKVNNHSIAQLHIYAQVLNIFKTIVHLVSRHDIILINLKTYQQVNQQSVFIKQNKLLYVSLAYVGLEVWQKTGGQAILLTTAMPREISKAVGPERDASLNMFSSNVCLREERICLPVCCYLSSPSHAQKDSSASSCHLSWQYYTYFDTREMLLQLQVAWLWRCRSTLYNNYQHEATLLPVVVKK